MYIRTRLALLVALLLGATLALVGTATYKLLRHGLLIEIERDVARRAAAFAASRPTPPYPLDIFAAPDVFLQIVTPDGAPVAGSGNLGGRVLPLDDGMRAGRVVEHRVAGRPLFMTAAPLADGAYVIVARSPVTIYGALRTLRRLLNGVIFGALVVTGLLSWVVARAALRPVERVAAAAEAVKRGRDLRQRVGYRGPQDELGRLAATFNAMLAELESAYGQLDASNQRLRQFLADSAHELRAPLTLITSNLDLLAREGASDAAFATKALADMRGDADRMARMITQLLILGRADAGAQVTRRPVALAETIADALRQGQNMAEGLEVVNAVGGTLDGVVVYGHADYLKQVILILLDNACKYTTPPGVIRVEALLQNGHVHVSVADTGAGIDPEDLPHIFERFYRGKNAVATSGTGLGLAIARWIAEQHGGRIEVESQRGAGSRFTVVLPLAASLLPNS